MQFRRERKQQLTSCRLIVKDASSYLQTILWVGSGFILVLFCGLLFGGFGFFSALHKSSSIR